MERIKSVWLSLATLPLLFAACSDDDNGGPQTGMPSTVTVENVLDSRPLVQSGTFEHEGSARVIMPGESISFQFSAAKGQALSFATMYGFSNDWFFASKDNGVDASQKGDISTSIGLFDNGTAVNQFPGAGITQFNLAGTPLEESKAIEEVPNPNTFTTLPTINNIIKVTLQ